jgi:hypothetical protein
MEEQQPLEFRMYFFVPYNISPIQQAIQAGHSALEYAFTYGQEEDYQNFIKNWKTWIILNGGTTNNRYDFEGKPLGSMNEIIESLQGNAIQYAYFQEPDLNDALTAICFLCDERVFNRVDYPDFAHWLTDVKMYVEAKEEGEKNNPGLWMKIKMMSKEEHETMFPEYYKEWVRLVGGVKNVFLRELIRDKKLA